MQKNDRTNGNEGTLIVLVLKRHGSGHGITLFSLKNIAYRLTYRWLLD